MTFSIAAMLANKRMFWNVRAMPAATMRFGFFAVRSLPPKDHGTAVGLVQPGQHVEQRGLARAVGPDQPVDFATSRC